MMMKKLKPSELFGRPSWPEQKEFFAGWSKKYRARPGRSTALLLIKIPFCLYFLAHLWPFITDAPYLAVLIMTFAPFFAFTNLRNAAQKSGVLKKGRCHVI